MGSPNPIVSRIQVGRELRTLRETFGHQRSEAAEELECDVSKIAKVETGERSLTVPEVKALLRLYAIPEDDWEPVLRLARDARRRSSSRVADYARKFAALEAECDGIQTYQTETVPGLFQIEEYARVVTMAVDPRQPDDVVEQFVGSRMARAQILTGPKPPHIWAVLNEGVLRRQVGGREVMAAQLDRLTVVAALPTVSVHVLPFSAGAHAAMGASFVLLQLSERLQAARIVYLEDLASADYLDQPGDVRLYTLTFDRLVSGALDPVASIQLIDKIRHEI